jgi:WD40 repeat protein
VLVWDVKTRALQKPLPELEEIFSLRFSPDSKRLACTYDGGVALYHISTFNTDRVAWGGSSVGIAFSPDSQVLAYHNNDLGLVRLWDIQRIRYLAALRCALAFWMDYSKDGKTLVAVSMQQVRIWNLAGASEKLALQGHGEAVRSVVFSPDGRFLATSGMDHKIKIWNPVTGALLEELPELSTAVWSLCFSPDGRVMAIGNYGNGTVLFYDMESRKALTPIRASVGRIFSTAFSPDGQYFAAAGENGLMLWRVLGGARELSFQPVGPPLTSGYSASISFSPNSNWLAWVEGDWAMVKQAHKVHVWDLRRGQHHAVSLAESSYWWEALAFCPNSEHLVLITDEPAIAVWDTVTKQKVHSFGEEQLERRGIVRPRTHLSADGAWYAVAHHAVTVWDMAAKKLLVTLPAEQVASVSWSPNRKLLAVGGADGSLEIWNLPKVNESLAEIGLGW